MISHPLDMSHLVNAQKSFLTSSLLRNKKFQLQRFDKIRTADASRRTGAFRKVLQHNSDINTSPKLGQLMWLQKVSEANAERFFQKDNAKNRTILKKIGDEALANPSLPNNSIHIDKVKIFEKSVGSKAPTPDTMASPGRKRLENPNYGAQEAQMPNPEAAGRMLSQNSRDTTQGSQGRDSPPIKVVRKSPKMSPELLRAGVIERRGVMNIHSSKPLQPVPASQKRPRQRSNKQEFHQMFPQSSLHQKQQELHMKIKMSRAAGTDPHQEVQLRASIGLGTSDQNINADQSSVKDTIEEIILKDNSSQCKRKSSFKSFMLGTDRISQEEDRKRHLYGLETTAMQGMSDENLKRLVNPSI